MKPILNPVKTDLSGTVGKSDNDNTPVIINNEDSHVDDKVALLGATELVNLKKLKTISRIRPEQVINLTKLDLFSKTMHSSFCQRMLDDILQLQISLNGYGRKELVQLVQQRSNDIDQVKLRTSKEIFR
jgi:hypothetical protein